MNEDGDFESLYALKLAPLMTSLKQEGDSTDKWGIIALLSFVAAIVIGFFALEFHYSHVGFLFSILISVAIVATYKYSKKNDKYIDDYKASVIKEIIAHLYPDIIYKPDESISQHEYKTSSLFRAYYDYFDGDDYIEGVVNNVSFHCSQLHTQFENMKTIFKGLFFVVKINSAFTGGTYVWARGEEQLPATMMDEYRLMPIPRIRDLYIDKDFAKYYRVCTTYESQALTILTPAMRQRMIMLTHESGRLMAFSFVAGNCYFAIPAGNDLLEPPDTEPGDKEEVKKYYYTIQLIIGIINQLHLEELA
ncbi:MAG: DUF3137 domain-containing protein [Ginsengibacter sp.]